MPSRNWWPRRKLGPKAELDYTPADVRREFFAGHAAMALSWPMVADSLATILDSSSSLSDKFIADDHSLCRLVSSIARLARRVQSARAAMERAEARRRAACSALGTARRLALIARETPSAEAAFQFSVWLSGDECRAHFDGQFGDNYLPPQPNRPAANWVESGMSPAAPKQYGEVAAQSFRGPTGSLADVFPVTRNIWQPSTMPSAGPPPMPHRPPHPWLKPRLNGRKLPTAWAVPDNSKPTAAVSVWSRR